jgi:hypothetical protein
MECDGSRLSSAVLAGVQAKTILGVADKLIALGRRGIKDTRGRAPSILRAPAAAPAAEQKAEADKPRAPEK